MRGRSQWGETRRRTIGVQPGEVHEPWGGVWRGGGDPGAGPGEGSRGAEPGDEVIDGVESEVGSLEGRQSWGGANMRGRGFRRRSGLEEMGRGGAR